MKQIHLVRLSCPDARRSPSVRWSCIVFENWPCCPQRRLMLQGFVPPGWHIKDQGSQDLNGDGSLYVLRDTGKTVVVIPPNDAIGQTAAGIIRRNDNDILPCPCRAAP